MKRGSDDDDESVVGQNETFFLVFTQKNFETKTRTYPVIPNGYVFSVTEIIEFNLKGAPAVRQTLFFTSCCCPTKQSLDTD